MTLLDEMKTSCVMMDKRSVPDGLGGFKYKYVDGVEFQATIIKDTTTAARVAEKDGMKEVYTIVVSKGNPLEFHDIFKRVSDDAVFRVTSNIVDSEAPARSTVQIGKVSAERIELPDD